MRIYEGQIPGIATDIANALIDEEVLEVLPENHNEFELDVQAVLREYSRMDRELTDRAKDISYQRGSGHGSIAKIKRGLAREKNFKTGEDALEYIVQQLIETFFHTVFVEEVFGEDNDIRRTVTPVLKRHMGMDKKLDDEVRAKTKNLEEGTQAWDIEYQRVMERIKQNRGLE